MMQQQQGEDFDLQQTSPLSVVVPPEGSRPPEVSLLLHFLLALGQGLSPSNSPLDLSHTGGSDDHLHNQPPAPRFRHLYYRCPPSIF